MTERPRVAITGVGVLSAIGRGARATLESVAGGHIGIRPIRGFDASDFTCRIAGEVDDDALDDEHRGLDRFARLSLIAANEAHEQSGIGSGAYEPTRVGTIIGSGLGGCETLDAGYERLYGQRMPHIPPFTIPRSMYNAATSAVSAAFDARGPAFGVVSACASGAHAIGQAAIWIRAGLADAVIAGGADAPIVPGIVRAWESLRVLAHDREGAAAACRPFSADRSGMVLAVGAADVILERLDGAISRGAPLLGELIGVGFASDAGHVTDPSPEGAATAIRAAIHDARIEPDAIGYINAHGTATRANDPAESRAIRIAFGAAADRLPVSSSKAMHGHAMGASGSIELVLSLVALNEGLIPPTMNYRERDPACDLDYVPNAPREGRVGIFASSSFGFGGLNAVLVVRTAHGMR